MIRGIHYFSTELKTKIDVIPRGCFNVRVATLAWLNSRMREVVASLYSSTGDVIIPTI